MTAASPERSRSLPGSSRIAGRIGELDRLHGLGGRSFLRLDDRFELDPFAQPSGEGAGGPSFVDPFALTLAANGDILVSDQNAFGGGGGVIRVDPVTGVRTTVTQNSAPSGPPSTRHGRCARGSEGAGGCE